MNNHRLLSRRTTFSAIGLVATTLLAGAAFAQLDGGAPPPPAGAGAGAPGGGAGGGGGRRGGGQRGGRQMTVSQIPVDGLDAELKLTADQKTKIAAIQKPIMDMRASMMPKPGEQPQFDRTKMQEMQEASRKADTDITALLTPEQTTALPDVLKEVQGLQTAGVPAGVLGALALTPDEKTAIIEIGAKAGRRMRTAMQDAQGDPQAGQEIRTKSMADTKEKVEAALTPAQKTTYDAYMAAHPQPAFGGFGGGGRRGGGGAPGGPPPA